MQQNYNKKRKLNKLKASLLLLMMVCFALPVAAQTRDAADIRMKTGNEVINDNNTYNFYDSGGPYIMPPAQDPNNNYNWVTWYQHNESYLLHLVKPSGFDSKGIKIVFNYLLVNDDHLKIYEGDLEDPDKLIVDLTNNDYSTDYGSGFTVQSHGNMTIRFTSNSSYRDAGWDALVELYNYTPQPPVALLEACDNLVYLLPGSMSLNGSATTKMYYTTDGTVPVYANSSLSNGTEYTGPFPITSATTVKAILVENGNASSTVSTYTINSLVTPPVAPTITRVAGTNDFEIDAHWVEGLRDTYYIHYTIDGSDPKYAPSEQQLVCSYRDSEGIYHNKINTVTMNGIGTLRVVTRGTTCPDLFSAEASVAVDQIFVPSPTIDVTGTGSTGSATISCSLEGVTIYYTLDGSDPTTSTITSGSSPINLTGIPAGTTIKAMAAHSGTGYVASGIASAIYIPSGTSGGNGVYGDVVLLDDREPHTWSYYSDGDQPVHRLNPADVKITYFGYGNNTMTTDNGGDSDLTNDDFDGNVASTAVAVGPNDAGNQFVYLKTLENANEDGSGNYPYTLIPNPFSVRPTYTAPTRGESNGNLRGNRDEELTIGTGTNYSTTGNNSNGYGSPVVNPYYYYSTAQFIYTSAEMGDAKTLTSLAFYHNNGGTINTNLTIYLVNTNTNTYGNNPSGASTGTLVYTGNDITIGGNSAGWQTFTLDTPFEYDGTSNLLVIVCRNRQGDSYSSNQRWQYSSTGNNTYRAIYRCSDTQTYGSLSNTSNYNRSNNRPNIRIGYTVGPKYNVNIAPGITGGTVSASPTEALEGAMVTLTITPSGNNTVNSVTVTGITTGNTITVNGTGNTRTFTMPDEDVTVNATFNDALAITVVSSSGGSVTANPSSAVPGVTVTLSITTNTGCELTSITVTGNSTGNTITLNGTGNTRTFTMPNEPVTVRALFNDPNAKYRGFYAWRVKRLSSGLTIQDGDGNTYGLNSIIPAETKIEFITSKEEGNEVDFEALWAQAYVNTSNSASGLNSSSYERNFVVGATPSALSVPVTYSSYYPDGTGGSTTSYSLGTFTCDADTKFEYMNISGTTVTANNHDLIFGRGISGTVGNVQGINGTIGSTGNPSGLNYMIRLESGTFSEFSFVRKGTACTVYGRVQVRSILGCDYDRAQGANGNNNLTICPTNNNNSSMFFTQLVNFYSESNKDKEVFNCVIKSGEFQRAFWTTDVGNGGTGETNFNYRHSIYCGANFSGDNDNHYPGVRYVTVEGGEMGNINGGRGTGTSGHNDEPNYVTNQTDANVVSFNLRIKNNPIIHGCVFGGAANTSAWGSKSIIVTGGEIYSWIAGGANGTNTTSGDSRTRGTAYIYVGGNAIVGGTHARQVNNTAGGQVFGAGRGNINQAASMDNSKVVIADNAEVTNVYGGGNIGYIANEANVHILGGMITGNVFGGAYGNALVIPTSNVIVKGGTVNGSVYGGSNSTGTVTNSHVTMSGGTVTNVYGGGLGTSTVIGANTEVAVSGGTINNNVYGGGALGTVTGNTNVTVSGGAIQNVFGAGQGRAAATGVTAVTANIGGTTAVTVSGGTLNESVYGGGEIGNVQQATNPYSKDANEGGNRAINAVSTVEITGGTITGNVFGGGKEGYTNGGTVVNMSGGLVEGSVFGGALGLKDKVYVAGQRTVNMRGGTVNKHVYGGSRNADDALEFNPGTFASSTEKRTASVVNFAGGYVHYQVFASGYFGKVYGSTYAFIGTNAILNAPNHVAGTAPYNADYYNQHTALRIGGSVWAGGDFGNYDGTKFGDPTISGRSHVYIDGLGYDTESNNTTNTNYMSIGGSVYGSGTSCDAGKQGRHIIIRNYGTLIEASQPTAALPYSSATRSLYSVQRADSLDFDNSHIVFLGEGRVNSLVTTEKYSIHEFQKVRIDNGSSIFLNYPADQIKKFGSYRVDDVYSSEPTYTKVTYETSSLEGTPNKIRVNNGAYIQIKYVDDQNVAQYGELEGFAYMMSDDENNTCAYARPKQSTEPGNIIPDDYDNPDDGGWVSYDATKNTYNIDGGTVTSGGVQMPYENHTVNLRNGEQYFRIWRAGGTFSYREGVFVAQSDGTKNYSTVDVRIDLPAFENCDGMAYYRIKTLSDGNTTIDYGNDVMMVNAACYGNVGNEEWMYIDGENANSNFVTQLDSTDATLKANGLKYIRENPNVNFGLVAIPSEGLNGSVNLGTETEPNVVTNENMLICEASDAKVGTMKWYNTHNEKAPQIIFRLTYNNNLTNNVVWDPITVTFEQISCDGEVAATVDVALTVTTLTSIDQDFVTQAYAITRGTGTGLGSYTAKVVLPQYVMHVNSVGDISDWTCEGVTFEPKEGYSENLFVDANGGYMNPSQNVHNECNNKFGMTLVAGLNFDNTTGWDFYPEVQKDMYGWTDTEYIFGQTTARDPIGFDFTLVYDNRQKASGNYQVGTLNFRMKFTNYENVGGQPYIGHLNIKIEVWFLGIGANYYIDGEHGNNLYSGKYPNAAKKTLSGIYNRTDYHAGDYIFVVDKVTADGSNQLSWNGKAYDEVTLFRYPGGHECVPNESGAESHWENYNIESNACYQGPLVVVEKNMEMTGIVLDGFYNESLKDEGTAAGDLEGHYHTYQPATAPLVEIKNGGRLTVYGSSRLEHNYNNTTDGGGVYVENGGVFNLYDGSAVKDNYVSTSKNGGGVYVNNTSKVQLSDVVTITGNQQISNSKAEGVDNNVYLSTYDSHVDVGTSDTDDPYTMLLSTSRVGITKVANPSWGDYWYAPVAFSDGGQQYLGNLISSDIMWDDQHRYDIVSLNNTHYNEPLNYVYFVGTWVTEVTSEPDGFEADKIDTPQELAWAISVASGYNGQTAAPATPFTLTGDIDMSANIWVPIGSNGHPYTGTFNGNGHVVTGLRSPMNQENMGMFGSTNGATITDLVAQANFAGGTMKNLGTVIGTMNGGTLSNVEAAGTLVGTNSTLNMGGLVGQTTKEGVGVTTPVIHSGFAVNEMTGGNNTVVGGLVGTNGGDLYNSYSNVTLGTNNAATTLAGLVGVNTGTVENCYVVLPEGFEKPAFVHTNQVTVDNQTTKGNVNYCYAASGTTSYVGSDAAGNLTGHGTYDVVKGRKEIGYMYDDNAVTALTTDTTYVRGKLTYNGSQIATWPGLVSTLNQWVKAKSTTNVTYTPWFRPISGDINGDLPVLGFPKDNSLGTVDGKFLRYGSNVDLNGVDALLTAFNDNNEGDPEPAANLFLYGAAENVANVPTADVNVFINEDAILLQADGADDFINATVGVTFDNSCKKALDHLHHTLEYDWHFMSSALQDAPINTADDYGTPNGVPGNPGNVNITGLDENCYFPNGLTMGAGYTDGVKWDFYTYYEPEYHWINLKRNDHWHQDNSDPIDYPNETQFEPGKGYMMAISQDSYMNSTGKLNKGGEEVTLYNKENLTSVYNKGWNLVGNPYQAYLDLSQIEGHGDFYIYDADQGVFAPVTDGQSTNPCIPSLFIHPHQGFFMHSNAENGGSEVFTFNYDWATATNEDASYFRGGEDRINYPLVNIFAENEAGNRDLAVVEFNRPELGGATKVNCVRSTNFQIAASLEGQRYGLVFTPEGTERVPVHFTTEENGTFTLTWNTHNGNFTSLLLVDNMTGTITDMLRADHYTFDATTEDYASRFYLTYTVTGVDEYNEGDGSFAFFDGSEWVVNGKGQLDIVDVMGRVLFSERLANEHNRVSLNGVANGVYLMRVTDGKNTMVQKIVVK